MEKFVRRQNIQRYRELLAGVAQRETLERLLAEEEADEAGQTPESRKPIRNLLEIPAGHPQSV
jgi:hypothetical protein